jgi:RNA polymerase sigma factor for flagellar operon FliA
MSESVGRRSETRTKLDHEKTILEFLPLVKYVIGRLPIAIPPPMDIEDLFSVGVLGLIHAVRTYDPDRGAIFKTYAYLQIKGAILDELRRQDPIPRSHKEKIRAVEKCTEELLARLGRVPSIAELEEETGIRGEELDSIFASIKAMNILSLDRQYGSGVNGGERTLRDLLKSPASEEPEEVVRLNEQKTLLAKAIQKLPPECRQVILLYYREGLLLREIGEILEVTESRVSQIHGRSLYLLNQEIRRMGG